MAAEQTQVSRVWWSFLLLIALVLGAFLPVINNGFVAYDDNLYVTSNPHVRAGLSWAGLEWALGAIVADNWHPLTLLSHMLDVQLFGLNPWGHHLSSVLLHAASTVLLFAVFSRMTGNTGAALFVAALFGIHPLRVESVAWVAERKDVLSGLLFMLTLWAYVRYSESTVQLRESKAKSSAGPPKRRNGGAGSYELTSLTWYAAALGFFILGLMSKPMLVTLPFVLLLLDYWPLQRFQLIRASASRPNSSGRFSLSTSLNLLIEKIPFLLMAAAASVVTFLVQQHSGAVVAVARLPIIARCENAVVSYCLYVGKLFWPADLAVLYPHPGHWPALAVWAAALGLLAVSAAALLLRRNAPWLLVGWFWFLGMLIPVLGLVQVGRQSLADRYSYLPLIGLLLVAAWGISALSKRLGISKALPVAATVAVLLCAGLTWRQSRFWKDDGTLFAHAVAVTKANYVAHLHLGDYWQAQGRLEEAVREYALAVRHAPDDAEARDALAAALLAQGRSAEASVELEAALKLQPSLADAHRHLALALEQQGRSNEALQHLQACVQLAPDDAEAQAMLGTQLLRSGQLEPALIHLDRSARLRPDQPETLCNLGIALMQRGSVDQALTCLDNAVRLKPAVPEFHYNLARALEQKGRRQEARAQTAEALRLRGSYPAAEQLQRSLTGQ